MMFFQGVLLAGYLYAHLSVHYLPKSLQVLIQVTLLATGALCLPFVIDAQWVPNHGLPAFSLLQLLFAIAALPLFALSASAPLLQRWFSYTHHFHANDPYFLYVASTLGSFCGLLGFPFLIEPWFRTQQQTFAWMIGFVMLIVLTLVCGISRLHERFRIIRRENEIALEHGITWRLRLYWVMLAFVPSSLMLGVTRYITTDIASGPLFWIVPFLLYLLTFVMVFARRPLISLQSSKLIQLGFVAPFLFVLTRPQGFLPFIVIIAIHLGMFFFTTMVCHGEMVARRPDHRKLTEFYLLMAVGGFLGGVFNSLLAPLIFARIFEYHIVYLFALLLCPPALFSRRAAVVLVGLSTLIFLLFRHTQYENTLYVSRNFFGSTRVKEVVIAGQTHHVLVSGTTIHGGQNMSETGRPKVVSYYYPLVDLVQLLHEAHPKLKIGIAGLGVGVTACVAEQQDEITFYEIDPTMLKLASDPSLFTYLSRCPPKGGVVMGDARIQLAKAPNQHYDMLVLDVFSSDSIPIHLLTQQAIALYLQKIRPDGVLLMHISNRYLDLHRVVASICDQLGVNGWLGQYVGDERNGLLRAQWVAISRSAEPFGPNWDQSVWQRLGQGDTSYLWTDDYSNLFRVIRWR